MGLFDERLAGQGGGLNGGFVGVGGHKHAAAQLAVDLQHQFHFVALQGRFVHLGPGRIQQLA